MSSREGAFKIVLLGDSASKTTLVNRYLTKVFDDSIKMTIGADFYVKDLEIDGKKVVLRIWDLGGEQRFKVLLPSFAKGADGALFIYDIANRTSINNIDDWLSIISREDRTEIPTLLVGITSDDKSKRQVSAEEGKEIAKSKNLNGFIECSVRTGENVDKAFEVLNRLVLRNRIKNVEDILVYGRSQSKRAKFGVSSTNESSKWARVRRLVNYVRSKFNRAKRSSPKTHSEPSLRLSPYPKQPRDPDWESMGAIMDTIRALSDLSSKQNRIDLDSQLGPTGGNSKAGVRVNINPQLKGEILSFLEWIKDSEGLSGYINYYLQQNNPSIISELSKIYSELRQIIEKSLESSKSFNFNDSENNGDKNYDGDDYLPHPYIFIHPKPPNDFEPAPQSQLRAPLKDNKSKDESICQYCGRKLSKEEQFTHSCNRFFLG